MWNFRSDCLVANLNAAAQVPQPSAECIGVAPNVELRLEKPDMNKKLHQAQKLIKAPESPMAVMLTILRQLRSVCCVYYVVYVFIVFQRLARGLTGLRHLLLSLSA